MTPHILRPKNNGWIFLWWVIALATILIMMMSTGCNPQKHLNRFIKRNPGLVKIDTLKHMDTLIIRERRVDTLFYFNQKDTIIKESNGVILKYYFNTKDSTVYLEGKTKTDTIIREIHIPYQKVEAVLNPLTFGQKIKLFILDWLPLLIGLFLLGMWVRSLLKRKPQI